MLKMIEPSLHGIVAEGQYKTRRPFYVTNFQGQRESYIVPLRLWFCMKTQIVNSFQVKATK